MTPDVTTSWVKVSKMKIFDTVQECHFSSFLGAHRDCFSPFLIGDTLWGLVRNIVSGWASLSTRWSRIRADSFLVKRLRLWDVGRSERIPLLLSIWGSLSTLPVSVLLRKPSVRPLCRLRSWPFLYIFYYVHFVEPHSLSFLHEFVCVRVLCVTALIQFPYVLSWLSWRWPVSSLLNSLFYFIII